MKVYLIKYEIRFMDDMRRYNLLAKINVKLTAC